MKLVNALTGEEIKVGDKVLTFRGEEYILKAAFEPGTPSGGRGEGKVQLEGEFGLFYASVIGAKFV